MPVRVAGSPAQAAVLYLNQLDNRSVGLRRLGSLVPPEAQCSATSLTMSLLSLYGGDRQTLLAECRSLATEQGQALADSSTEAIELAVMDVMLGTDWEQAVRRSPAYFEGRDWRPASHRGNRIIKNPFAQAYTASRFERCGDSGVSVVSDRVCIERGVASGGLGAAARWSWMRRMWAAGAELSVEAAFTQSGHVVYVLEPLEDRMLVHDPYGLWLGGGRYIRNGQAAPILGARAAATFARRVQDHPELVQQRDSGRPYARWGEHNRMSREEVRAIGGPTWALAIGTGEPELA